MFMERSAAALQAHELVLSNLSPSVAQRRFALGVVLVLLVVFVIVAGPLSGLPLRRVDAFIPAYGTAIFVIDSITAALLFAQFSILRSHASGDKARIGTVRIIETQNRFRKTVTIAEWPFPICL